MNNDDIFKRFDERIEAKKANKPKLHDFTAEFRVGIRAKDDATAEETVEIISKMLEQFEDISMASGKIV